MLYGDKWLLTEVFSNREIPLFDNFPMLPDTSFNSNATFCLIIILRSLCVVHTKHLQAKGLIDFIFSDKKIDF